MAYASSYPITRPVSRAVSSSGDGFGGVNIPFPPNAPAGAKLLLGADGAPLKGADGAYLFGVS